MTSFNERYDSFLRNLRLDATPPTCKSGSKLCGMRCVPQEDKCKGEKQSLKAGRKRSVLEKTAQGVNAANAIGGIQSVVKDKNLSGSQKAVAVAKRAALAATVAIAVEKVGQMNEQRKGKVAAAVSKAEEINEELRAKAKATARPQIKGNPTKSANAK